jgi:hypothetical protein
LLRVRDGLIMHQALYARAKIGVADLLMIFWGTEGYYRSFGEILDCIQTGSEGAQF